MLHPLEREMNRLFEDFWLSPFGETQRWAGTYLPAVNVREEDNQVLVSAELPGMKEDDIEVTVRRDGVRIAGEKKEEAETKEEDFYRMESSYGRFDRLVDLPAEVDEDKAEAEFKNGVLTVKMPKSEESKTKTRKIPVKTG
jgi:HSP20 family protein